jgi:predicted phage terminase large subunit-like protein
LMTLQSWDTASKGGPENDWSVCTTWILTRRKRRYLLDVWRRRVDYPAQKAAVKGLAKQWRPQRILVEDAVTGTALVQELREEIYSIIPVKPVGDKVTRMAVASAKNQAGQVFLPKQPDWLPDLEGELFAFPGSRHDDQRDTISQALFDSHRNMPMEITDEVFAILDRVASLVGSHQPRPAWLTMRISPLPRRYLRLNFVLPCSAPWNRGA